MSAEQCVPVKCWNLCSTSGRNSSLGPDFNSDLRIPVVMLQLGLAKTACPTEQVDKDSSARRKRLDLVQIYPKDPNISQACSHRPGRRTGRPHIPATWLNISSRFNLWTQMSTFTCPCAKRGTHQRQGRDWTTPSYPYSGRDSAFTSKPLRMILWHGNRSNQNLTK